MSTTSTTTKAPVTSPKPTTAPSTTTAMTSTKTREPTTLPTGAGKTVKTCADVKGCQDQIPWEIQTY